MKKKSTSRATAKSRAVSKRSDSGDLYTGKRYLKNPPRGYCRVYQWTSHTRTMHTTATKRNIAITSPQQLIRDVSAFAGYEVIRVSVSSHSVPEREVHKLVLDFGWENGTAFSAEVTLAPEDVQLIAAYLRRSQKDPTAVSVLHVVVPKYQDPSGDDDGGEELPVPTVSESAFEQMRPATAAVN